MEVQQNVSRPSYSDWLYFFLNLGVQTCTTFLEIRVLFLYPRNKVFFIFFQDLFYAEFADLSLHKSGILNSFGVYHCCEEAECLTLLSWFCISMCVAAMRWLAWIFLFSHDGQQVKSLIFRALVMPLVSLW